MLPGGCLFCYQKLEASLCEKVARDGVSYAPRPILTIALHDHVEYDVDAVRDFLGISDVDLRSNPLPSVWLTRCLLVVPACSAYARGYKAPAAKFPRPVH